MKKIIPSQRSNVDPFLAMDVLKSAKILAEQGRSICHMEVGQPSAPTPLLARNAANTMLEHGSIGYTQALGTDPLRQAIANYYKQIENLEVPTSRIAVCMGSSSGILASMIAAFDTGDCVAITAPGYPAYKAMLQSLGLNAHTIALQKTDAWLLTPEQIRIEHAKVPFRGLILMSPANPTGTITPPQMLQEIVKTCEELNIILLSDEIYHGLAYAQDATSALHFTDNAIIINSFSKYYCMTGWRIGWLVLPQELVRRYELLQQSLFISPSAISQAAAIGALHSREELNHHRTTYQNNRNTLLQNLEQMGFCDPLPADGAFYLYAKLCEKDPDSLEFCDKILNKTGVAITPGLDFDSQRGHRYIRMSYCASEDIVQDAINRIIAYRTQ